MATINCAPAEPPILIEVHHVEQDDLTKSLSDDSTLEVTEYRRGSGGGSSGGGIRWGSGGRRNGSVLTTKSSITFILSIVLSVIFLQNLNFLQISAVH